MPVYEYYCHTCEKVYEYLQKISDPPRETCEVCHGPLKKQISLSSFHLKGSGWYVTDYGGKNNGNGTSPAKEKEEKPADTIGKTETKPPAKDPKPSKSDSTTTSGKE